MKVVHVEAGRHLYGGARQVGYLVNALAARGVDNTVLLTPGHRLAGMIAGGRVVETPFGGDLDRGLGSRLIRLIAGMAPDVVHVHSRRGADLYAGRAAQRAGCPAILTRRVQSREPAAWIRFKCRGYRAVVAISSAVEAELAQAGIGPERIRRIPSAVDTAIFAPDPSARARLLARYGLPDTSFLAVMAAQFIPRKGHDLLLPLVGQLRSALPDFRVLVFGQGPGRARFERRLRRLGLERHILCCGFVDDWPRLLPGADLLLHPARREGLGAVVLEAMSAGVPVIAARAGGIVDAIDTAAAGTLLPGDSVDAWADAVARLHADPAGRAALAAGGRRRVCADFTIGSMTDRYLDIYRDIRGG